MNGLALGPAEGRGRRAGRTEGWVLTASTWLAVAGAAAMAPIAPQIAAHFAAIPHATDLSQLAIGLPALFVALLGLPFGLLADRIGRRPVLIGGMLVYVVAGTMPAWLDNLGLILASRAGVGIAEAAVLASTMALLGDYFQGIGRDHWAAVQGGTATIAAIVFIALSGAIGTTDWRAPFFIYALPLIPAFLVLKYTWEPSRTQSLETTVLAAGGHWRQSALACAVTLGSAIAFYLVLIQIPFLLAARGFDNAAVAFGTVAAAATSPLGSVIFRGLSGSSVALRLCLSYSLSAAGLIVIVTSSAYPVILIGAAINGIGSGIVFPTLITWALAGLKPAERGRVSGLWNASFFLGQFLSPLTVIGLTALVGDLTKALEVFAVALVIAAIVAFFVRRRSTVRTAKMS